MREQIKAGLDVIKLMATGGVMTPGVDPGAAQFTYEELKAGVEEAHKAGRRTASHAQGNQGVKNALRAGIDSIEHGVFLDDEAIKLFLDRKAALIPTISAPFHILEKGIKGGVPAYAVEKTKKVSKTHIESAKKAYRDGVTIAMGTDAGTPFNGHGENLKELELLVGIGLSPMEAILSATGTAWETVGLSSRIGTIEQGKLADLIVFEGTPSSGTLASCTGLPIATGISGLGTGVAAGLGNAATGTGSPVLALSPTITSQTISGTSGNLYSSSYVPTITNGTNITSSSAASQALYTRVGDQVFFNIRMTINPVAIGEISLEISLPIASNFTATNQAHGMAISTIGAVGAITGMQMAIISASIANDRLLLNGYAGDAASLQWNIIGKYAIL